MHSKESHAVVHAASLRPKDWLRFVQIEPFPKLWSKLGLVDEDLRMLEIFIMSVPERSAVIPGADGLRKLRFAKSGAGKGKSSSYRVYYTYFPEYGLVLLMAVIAKSQKADLTKADLKALGQVITRLKSLLDKGEIR